MINLNGDQIEHIQVVGIELATGGVGTLDYPELRRQIEKIATDQLAHRIETLGFVAIAEPQIRLHIEASVIHPGNLTPTQRLLMGLEKVRQ